jgi:hypothetical protein
MQSLRTFLPALCDTLGITVDKAYERQRLLVKAGTLRSRPGKGPGSGVPAVPRNIAILLVSLLVGDLRETPITRIKALAQARPLADCPRFGDSRFASVLAKMIENGFSDYRHWPLEIRVQRDTLVAEIDWPMPGSMPLTIIYNVDPIRPQPLRTVTAMGGHFLLRIRQAYEDAFGEPIPGDAE